MVTPGRLIWIMFFMMTCILSTCSTPYNFFYFSLEWPVTRCESRKGCCYPTSGEYPNDFIVSELQPSRRNNNGSPTFCDSNSKFDENKILNIRKQMQENWPSVDCPSNDGIPIWSYKWEKHGTCSILNQSEYFEAALNLKNKLNLLEILKNAGLEPSREKIRVVKVERAIKDAIGYTPSFKCMLDKENNRQLQIVRFCVDIEGKSFIECSQKTKLRTCKDEMKLPPFETGCDKTNLRFSFSSLSNVLKMTKSCSFP